MRDDDQPEPSLLLARHENAHREHERKHEHGPEKHQNHALRHRHNHRDATAIAEASVVTEVTTTISVVQQIDVDSNGNTLSILTVSETSSNDYPAVLTDSSSPTTNSPIAAASSNAASGALSTALNTPASPSSPLSSSLSASAASTSTPSTSASLSSLIVDSNSTTLISSSSSLSHNFANSTSFSSSPSARTSLTYLTSSLSLSTSYDGSSTATSVSSSSAFRSTPLQSTSTGALGGVVGGTAVTSGTVSTGTASGNGSNSSSGSPVSTRTVVGGVVGSVAGVAVIALLLLFLVKWRKNGNGALLSLGSGRDGADDGADAVTRGPSQPSGGMVERRSFAYAVPAALASLTGYKRSSRQTDQTVSSTAASERGFYRVSGRKLPSVLQTGGDGYGGGVPDDHTLNGSSFYRDSYGFYGGPGTPSFPPLETHRESGQIGTPVMRPSPARTPVTEQGPFSTAVPPDLNPLPPRPDLLGRSHPSQDGSHASRFTEEV